MLSITAFKKFNSYKRSFQEEVIPFEMAENVSLLMSDRKTGPRSRVAVPILTINGESQDQISEEFITKNFVKYLNDSK
jgi:hypothetical protein